MAEPGYRRKLDRARTRLDELDDSIRSWLDGNDYKIVIECDPKTRRTEVVARLSDMPDWSLDIGEVAHQIRSALDQLALALNRRGYADANRGANLPMTAKIASEFPIFGDMDGSGHSGKGPALFKSAKRRYRSMPAGAIQIIEGVQPYTAGADRFTAHPLWIAHELDRVDKHHEPLAVAAAVPSQMIENFSGSFESAALGVGGPVHDGKVLSWWIPMNGTPEPNAEFCFTRDIALGEGTPTAGAPVVETLRHVWEQIEAGVVTPLELFV